MKKTFIAEQDEQQFAVPNTQGERFDLADNLWAQYQNATDKATRATLRKQFNSVAEACNNFAGRNLLTTL